MDFDPTHGMPVRFDRANGWHIAMCRHCATLPFRVVDPLGKTHSFQQTLAQAREVLVANYGRGFNVAY